MDYGKIINILKICPSYNNGLFAETQFIKLTCIFGKNYRKFNYTNIVKKYIYRQLN